jgi:hypothetical protein
MGRMSQVARRVRPRISKGPKIPPLQNGDHLTAEEFARRWDATPGLKKAELIDGVVYIPPPAPFMGHSKPHGDIIGILGFYEVGTPGVSAGASSSLRLDSQNYPLPDAVMLIDAACGGQTKIDGDGFICNGPDLIAEIAASAVSYELHQKLSLYRRNGVREYIVWRTLDGEIDYFVLQQGEYRRLSPGSDGVFRSGTFPGLWVDADALLRGDLASALKTLQLGIGSPEHETFIAALRHRAGANPAHPS